MKKIIIFLVLLFCLCLTACQVKTSLVESQPAPAGLMERPIAVSQPGQAELSNSASYSEQNPANFMTDKNTSTGDGLPQERLIIKTGNLVIQVADVISIKEQVIQKTTTLGGYVVQSEVFQNSTAAQPQTTTILTIRIPANEFENFLQQIRNLTTEPQFDILSDVSSGNDVTADFIDQQSRLHSLEITARQLETIMNEARRTEDVLAVFNQLQNINQQIEVAKGQIKYLSDASQMAAVHLTIQAKPHPAPLQTTWLPELTASQALQQLLSTFKWLAEGLIWLLLYCFPLLILFGLPVFLLSHWLLKQKRKNAGTVEKNDKKIN